jgi:hypothetical protein
MSSGRLTSRIAIFAGGAAIVAMGALTSCSSGTEKEAPSSTPSTPTSSAPSSSAASPTPTEKRAKPDYDASFTPAIDPVPPGAVCREVHNGVCIR